MGVLRYKLLYNLPMSKIKIESSLYYAIRDIHTEIIVFLIKTIINIFINEEYF